jgi:hypothetical protein
MKKRNYKRLPTTEIRNIEKILSTLPHPLFIERKGKSPVKVIDLEGDAIELTAYHQLTVLLKFIRKNCPHQ